MNHPIDRRDFLKLAGLGGAVFVSGCASMGSPGSSYDSSHVSSRSSEEFYFVQLSDTHWGFEGPPNPDAKITLKKAVAAVNDLEDPPDFIVFTGDLTHTTDDPKERRRRLAEFKSIVGDLKVKTVRFIPGEHDASLDMGAAFKEFFGETHYSFDHKGVHFIVVDNVSDPVGRIGDEQLKWMEGDLKGQAKDTRIVVFTHRPLFDLAPKWDWATRDGDKAIALLNPYPNVTVFYGHIHQENHHMTGHIAHHSAKSLIFALPAPNSQPNRTPLPWNPKEPYKGLGFREVTAMEKGTEYEIVELPVQKV